MPENKKNTLKNTSMTKPLIGRVPPKNPQFANFAKPTFKGGKFNTAFRSQNRGGSGK